MKTAGTIERQESTRAEKNSTSSTVAAIQNREPVTEARRRSNANLKLWKPGQSGNPGGKPKADLAAQIARAIFEHDAPAIFDAYAKMLRKGSPYAFQVLSDRAYGKLKESHQVEVGPFKDLDDAELKNRIKQLEQQLGVLPAHIEDDDTPKPN